ncbi:Serine/threonine-protein kinase [Ceratobasidium sp. AG-Ba]|nr:Serine/threonine-protein kinase [Ceratobasidium sp. AG-Ba]
MAATLSQMMRKSDSASRPEEEGESPEEENREREELLREQLTEEGYDIRGVQSVHVASPHHISPLDPFIEDPPESSMYWTGEKVNISTAPAEDPSYTSPTLSRPEATSTISRFMSAQVCNGLAHLHSCDAVHGDLKGLNVLISSSGVPMLTDFGDAILRDYTLQFTGTTTRGSVSPCWAAPELLEGSTAFSKEADVYALAMETITGRVPYYGKGDHAVWFAVGVKREMPQRPGNTISTNSEQGDILWTLLISCWSHEPKERPSAGVVASTMKSIKSRNIVQATEIHWALGVQLG